MGFLAPLIGLAGGALGLGSVGIALAQAVVGVGLGLIAKKIEDNQAKKAAKAAAGTQFEREYGENVSRKVACGPVGVAGHDCYVNTYGGSNRNLEQVFCFSDFPCDGLVRIWAGGTLLSLSSDDGVHFTVTEGDYAGRMSFTFYDGLQTTADAAMIANSNPAGRWTADHVGAGLCWLKAELVYDREKLNQFPEFFFELRGARLYDFRKDSTVGGSGTHRWGDYSTYEYTENPIVMDYNYRRGFSWGGDLFLGMDMPASDLPLDKYFVAANICDETGDDGEKRYRCSVIFDADVDHGDNIDAVMTSCGGLVVDGVDGSWPLVGAEQPIAETFTDDDLVTGERVRFQRRRSMSELVNAVSGTYYDRENMWSPAGYDTQTNAAWVALDRRTRDVALNFETVFSKFQANQLASLYFNENRYEATADIVLRPRFRTLKAGDWVRWDSARYGSRVYMVVSRSIKAATAEGPRNVTLSLQERDGAIYEGVGVVAPTLPVPNGEPVYLNALQDWAIIPVLANGADGRTYPAFRMSWSPIADVSVTAIDFQWWVTGAPENVFTRRVRADEAVTFIQEGVLGSLEHEFRHRLVADRPTNWSAVRSALADEGTDDFIVTLADIGDDVRARFQELAAEMNDYLRPTMERIVVDFSLMAAASQVAREAIMAEAGSARVEIVEEKRVRADETAALGQLYTALRASFNGNVASVQTMLTTLANADIALASSISAVEATAAGNTAAIASEATARADGDAALTTQVNQLWAASGDNAAAITAEQTARSNADGALATSISNVQAAANTAVANEATARQNADNALSGNIATVNAAVQSEATARADADGALATSISGVSADFNGRFAQGLIRFQAVSAPSGIDARFAIVIRGGTSDSYKVTGLYLDLYTEAGVQKSRLAIMTDQFVVTDGTNSSAALTFEAGQLKALFARFGTVNAGILQSPNGKMAINLTAGTIVVSS